MLLWTWQMIGHVTEYIPRVASIQFNFYSQMDLLAGISMRQARYIYMYIRFGSDIIYDFRTLSFPSSSGIIPSLQLSMSRWWLKVRFRPAMYPCNPLSTLFWRRSGLNDYSPYAWYRGQIYISYSAFILHEYYVFSLRIILFFYMFLIAIN